MSAFTSSTITHSGVFVSSLARRASNAGTRIPALSGSGCLLVIGTMNRTVSPWMFCVAMARQDGRDLRPSVSPFPSCQCHRYG